MKSARLATIGTALALLLLAAPHPATAEVIVINRGTFDYEDDIGVFDIAGTRGFRFNGRVARDEGRFPAIDQCFINEECTPGAVISMDAAFGGAPGSVAKLRGFVYDDVGGFDSLTQAYFEFTGSVTMPPMTGGPTIATGRFELAGVFAYSADNQTSQQAFLTGGGIITLYLEPLASGSWRIQRAVFTFRPARR